MVDVQIELRLASGIARLSAAIETLSVRLTVSLESLTEAIDRLDRESTTLRSDARSDFRLLFGAIIATAFGLAGLIAKSAHWL
jgi:hypothetical protein